MDREQFLQQVDVKLFIEWMIKTLPTQEFFLKFSNSNFVPGGLSVRITGFDNILNHYVWKSSWFDERQRSNVQSEDWESTKYSLTQLRDYLRSAIETNYDDATLSACLAILKWGGVTGAIHFLRHLHTQKSLISYLLRMKDLMRLDGDAGYSLENLDSASVLRFDAGLTKIHAILDASGSPIYDSRVGAAIAMLYAQYRTVHPNVKSKLNFPVGDARGAQIRNPGDLGYQNASKFFTLKVSKEIWARNQVQLGWIIRTVLEHPDCKWFQTESDISGRCHAFEACLFMLGYDLRAFVPHNIGRSELSDAIKNTANSRTNLGCGWVPSGHPFSLVIEMYLNYRRTSPQIKDTRTDIQDFKYWIQKYIKNDEGNAKYKESTLNAYCFPLGENEFNLSQLSFESLEMIVKGGLNGLIVAYGAKVFRAGDERERVCLVDVWIAGVTKKWTSTERLRLIMQAQFAGTEAAARLIISVGERVGQHFGLLDKSGNPTDQFNHFFDVGMELLQNELIVAQQKMQSKSTIL